MERYEVVDGGRIIEGITFTDFNELDEMTNILKDNGLKPKLLYNGRGGYHVFQIEIEKHLSKLHIYLKKVTFGGRENRPQEKRAQFSAALDRSGYESKDNRDNIAIIIGIYKSNELNVPIVCTWNIDDWGLNIGRAFNCFTDVSTISKAYECTIAQHKTSIGQITCAFRPQHFALYLRFREIVHKRLVDDQDLLEFGDIELTDEQSIYEDSIPKMEDLFEPVVDTLRAHSGICGVSTMESEVADALQLSVHIRQQVHNADEGYRTELGYRLAWARYYLRLAGLIEPLKRKIWQLTELGQKTLVLDKGQIKRLRPSQEVAIAINREAFNDIDQEYGVEKDIDNDEGSIAQPFDPSLVDIRTRSMSLDLILKRLSRLSINMDTSFQRMSGLWSITQQSRLIESILVKIPLPVFYFDGSDDDNWLVVDGLQRLTALDSFVNKESFALKNLEFLNKFNGKTFSELPAYLQRRIEEFEITSYIIAPGTPQNLKFNVFKRINTGGLTLSTQEIRNALNQGVPAEFVKRLADMKSFKMATDFSIPEERMLDREFVTRFLAFYLFPIEQYNSDLEDFLNRAMEIIGTMDAFELEKIAKDFDNGMNNAFSIFGVHAFRKSFEFQSAQKPINKALFDVWSVLLSKLNRADAQLLIEKREILQQSASQLEDDTEFQKAISSSTNDKGRVRKRFTSVKKLITETLRQL